MRTDDLIRALAADHAPRSGTLAQRVALFSGLGGLGAACIYVALIEPRADLNISLGSPRVLFKFLVTLTLAFAAGVLLVRQARPETTSGLRPALLPVLLLLAVAVAAELALWPSSRWLDLLAGSNATACLILIPILSLAPLAAAFAVLRRAAPARPPLAGTVAGLLAGGMGAALYATHCTDDSPLFVATWYVAGIAIVAIFGTVLGRKFLRW